MFPHKINGNFLHIREARQAQRLLSSRRETKFSLPEAKGAAFPWLPHSHRFCGSIPVAQAEGRGLCRDRELRVSAAKAKEPLMELESWGCNCFPIVVSLFSSLLFKHLSGHCVKVSMENPPGCPEEGDVEICL